MTAFDRSVAQMSFAEVQQLYEAQIAGRLATTDRERLEVLYRREEIAAFMARLRSLPDAELLRVYQQMVCGIPAEEILRQLGEP